MTARAFGSLVLGLLLGGVALTASAAEEHLDFAGAKARAKESSKLLLVDFSSPT